MWVGVVVGVACNKLEDYIWTRIDYRQVGRKLTCVEHSWTRVSCREFARGCWDSKSWPDSLDPQNLHTGHRMASTLTDTPPQVKGRDCSRKQTCFRLARRVFCIIWCGPVVGCSTDIIRDDWIGHTHHLVICLQMYSAYVRIGGGIWRMMLKKCNLQL